MRTRTIGTTLAIALVAAGFAGGTTSGAAAAAAAKLNATCSKVGQTATAGTQKLVCTKVGTKNLWRAAATPTTVAAAATAATTAPATTAAPSGAAAWQDVIAKAKKEGKVVTYGSQAPDALNDLCSRFKKAYGIDCEVVRLVDNDTQAKLQAERDTNKPVADVVTISAATLVTGNADKGWYTPVTGPDFEVKEFNKAVNSYAGGKYFTTSAAILTFGWNTQLFSKGLKDYTDLLDPALKNGKIGIIDQNSPSIVDFYLYLEGRFGNTFLPRLAQQRPKIYPSALPMAAALASGEISAGLFVVPQGPAKANGAPVDSSLAEQLWGARYYSSVMSNAPHPNAAQLFANFMVTKDGQAAITKNAGAVLPGVEGSVVTVDKVKPQDLAKLTPDFVKEYGITWKAMFT